MKNLDIYMHYLIYEYLTSQDVGLLQLVNKKFYKVK